MADINFEITQYKNDVTSIKRVGYLKGTQHLKTVNRKGWTRRVINEEMPFMTTKEYKSKIKSLLRCIRFYLIFVKFYVNIRYYIGSKIWKI